MIVDLRSDTVTTPTKEMYDAMMNAPLGDDVLGDEPTVMRLEEMAAERMGKEAAMFTPSGTMANQIGIKTWVNPGDAIIVEQDAHVMFYESGGPGVHAQVVTWTLPSKNGVMEESDILDRITAGSIHTPATKLICLENSHNRAGGAVIPIEKMAAYKQISDAHGMKVHLDGARIFNAAIHLGVEASQIAQHADSVSFCLSKGLSCPVGSLLCGPADFIQSARQHRKRLGGSMRQAGVLAACGVVALSSMVDRLADDHANAKTLACAIAELPGIQVNPNEVVTNIVLVHTDSPASDWQVKLAEKNVRCFAVAPNRLRFVFHREISEAKTGHAITSFREIAKS